MTSTRSLASVLILAIATCFSPAGLGAQCCKDKAPVTTAAEIAGLATTKSPARLLYNEVCPLTGLVTSELTPVVAHAGVFISLCCSGCIPNFAKLEAKKKDEFVAGYTGQNRRVAFTTGKPTTAATAKTTAKPCCCEAAKVSTDAAPKADCCKDAATAAKPAPKAECCKDAAPAAKPAPKADCCKDAATAAKPAPKADCCKDAAPAATPAPKAECCKGAKPAAKAAPKAECCKDAATATKTAAKK